VFSEADRDALALLRALEEHHVQHNPEAPLSEGTRLGGVPGVDFYRITERGLQMLRSS
jgi:hypothetical protein